jgi:hypothetical protein
MMKRITTRAEFLERLKDIRIVEVVARRGYEEDIITFRNFIITDTIKKIKEDEDKHIKMLDELISMLSQ